MRLFFAAMLDDPAAAAVLGAQAALRRAARDDGVRWVGRAQLHYTLRFLGEVDEDRTRAAARAGRAAAAGAAPFEVRIAGAGAFPDGLRPRVLWLGATAGGADLVALAARLESALEEAGFAREERAFRPHLTMARVKTPEGERAASRALRDVAIGDVATVAVGGIALVRSTLRPQGSLYEVARTFALTSPDPPASSSGA